MSTTGIVKSQDVDDDGAGMVGVVGVVGAGGMGVVVADVPGTDVAGAGVEEDSMLEDLSDKGLGLGYFHEKNAETRGAMRSAQLFWKD
jgi:hypothetical protein